MKPKIGFVGAGGISRFHIEAARAAGFELHSICGREGSPSALRIAQEYGFNHTSTNVDGLKNTGLDAIVICASTKEALEIYQNVLELDIPVLIEKPVSTSLPDLLFGIDLDRRKTLVGYNRRFYSSIQQLRQDQVSQPLLHSHWNISELPEAQDISKIECNQALMQNSVHQFDLMRFLFGDLTSVTVERIAWNREIPFASAILRFQTESVASVNLTFGSPRNTSIEFFNISKYIELKPLENYVSFSKMRIDEPSKEFPIRRYSPVSEISWKISSDDLELKPGFLKQYLEFLQMTQGEDRTIGASLRDAVGSLQIADVFRKRILLP